MRMRKKKRKKTTMQNQPMKSIQLNNSALRLLKHEKRPLVCQEKYHHNRNLKEHFPHLRKNNPLLSHLANRHSLCLSKNQQHNLQHHLLSIAPAPPPALPRAQAPIQPPVQAAPCPPPQTAPCLPPPIPRNQQPVDAR